MKATVRSITFWTEHLPPSTNALFANVAGKGRIRSERYREWQNAAGWDFNGKGSIAGPFKATITVCASKRRKGRDIDNFAKPTLDLLVKHGVVEDDSLCEEVTLRWGDAAGGMRVEVRAA
jgi:crossover junction endodeoxyribonuclease RusA